MANGSVATILLVEDNPDHAEFALKALKRDNVITQVTWAKDGQEALDILQGRRQTPRPDLILLDIHLPKVNGHQVLRRVKADPDLRSIPVVMLSTSDCAADVNATYRAGANSYVSKPVSFKELNERLRALKQYWLQTNSLPASSFTAETT
jgi:two-component system response regulator